MNGNGFIVKCDGKFFGPFLSLDDIAVEFDGKDHSVRSLLFVDTAIKVKDCDRSECSHCRSIAREGRKALAAIRAKARREAASE